MVDDTFAFIIHPIQIKKDVQRKFPLLGKILTEGPYGEEAEDLIVLDLELPRFPS